MSRRGNVVADFRYVVFARGFNENSGGIIALHYLCHLLNELGHDASLAPMPPLRPRTHHNLVVAQYRNAKHIFRQLRFRLIRSTYPLHPDLVTPIDSRPVDDSTIVVYPEIVDGNPLMAANVVRWILYKSGGITGRVQHGADELYFYYQEAFRDAQAERNTGDILKVVWYRHDIYHQWNFGEREGTCFLIRKGRGRVSEGDLAGAHVLDGATHEEFAAAFNHYEFFVTYDPYTAYARYAALCGCIPVVVPLEGVSKEAWRPELELRYGIAYGMDDVEWAVGTRDLLLDQIAEEEARQVDDVERFVETSQTHFSKRG